MVVERGTMTVVDLSRTGLGFRTRIKHNIRAQDRIRVRFVLDNDKRSEVSQSAIVRRVSDYFVGAEFLDFEVLNDVNRNLGFYLMTR